MAEIARLAAEWNIPHITYGGTGEFLGNKTEFATLTRLAYNLNSFAKFYLEVLKVSLNENLFLYKTRKVKAIKI